MNINYEFVYNCLKFATTITTTTTDEDVEMEDVGPDLDAENEEKEKERKVYAKKIENESLRLRDSDFSEDSILHRSMQILYKRYGTNARLALKKIVEREKISSKKYL